MRYLFAAALLSVSASVAAAEHFLNADEIAKLEPHPDVAGVSRYITPGTNPSAYGKLIVGGVSFFFSENSKSHGFDADEAKQISDAMKAAMILAADDRAEVVLSAGPGTALLNVAITEIDLQNKKRGLLGYTPVGLVVTTAGNLSGMRMQLKDAHIEGEAVDSVTGERIAVFRLNDIGNWDEKKGLSWEDLRASLEASLGTALSVLAESREG